MKPQAMCTANDNYNDDTIHFANAAPSCMSYRPLPPLRQHGADCIRPNHDDGGGSGSSGDGSTTLTQPQR